MNATSSWVPFTAVWFAVRSGLVETERLTVREVFLRTSGRQPDPFSLAGAELSGILDAVNRAYRIARDAATCLCTA